MKDQSNKSKTSQLNNSRKTGALEQLPSSQKRNLRTGQLATPFTQPVNEVPAEVAAKIPALANAPVPPEPINQHTSTAAPTTTEPPYVPTRPTELSYTAPTTSLIEAAATANHQVVKAPPVSAPVAPAKPASEAVKADANKPVAVPPVNAPAPMVEMNVREIKSINTAEAKNIEANLEAKPDAIQPESGDNLPVQEFKEVKATTPVRHDIPVKPAVKAIAAGMTAATEVVELPLSATDGGASKPASASDLQLFNSLSTLTGDELSEPRTTKDKVKSIAFYAGVLVVLLGTALAVVLYVPNLREKLQDRLPAKLATLLGGKVKDLPLVSIQAEPIIYDEKEKTATLGGVITNLTDAPVGPIQLEFTLSNRNDVRQTENKTVSVDPSPIAPGTTGKYQFTISTKDYQDSKLARILNNQQSVKFKNLGVKDAPPVYENPQPPTGQINSNATKVKAPDNSVYDGSVTFK